MAFVLLHVLIWLIMHILYVAAVFCLLSVSAAVPVCEELVRPLDLKDFSLISGKWIITEAVVDHEKYVALLKSMNNSWVDIVLNAHDSAFFNKANMINGECVYGQSNLSLSNGTIQFSMEGNMTNNATNNSTVTLLRTCADCLVMNGVTFIDGEMIRTVHIFGRTGKLSDSDRETFRNQVKCLGLPQASFIHDEQQELCPAAEKKL